MDDLVAGIRRFQTSVYPQNKDKFRSLADGQSPKVLFVACSDSRVCPHLFTNAGPGDLFMLRNVGNLTPAYTGSGTTDEAAIEYAVTALRVSSVVICGHSDCGAMKALRSPSATETLPAVRAWLERAQSTVASAHAGAAENEELSLDRLLEVNVLRQLENLRTHPSVAARLAADDLSLHGWVYDIGSGRVRAYDDETGQFKNIDTTLTPLSARVASLA